MNKFQLIMRLAAPLAALMVAACAPQSPPTIVETLPQPAVEPTPGSTAGNLDQQKGQAQMGSEGAEGPAVVMSKSGGIAGISERWEIYADGRVQVGEAWAPSLEAALVPELISEIEELGFFEMESSSAVLSSCRDCFIYQVTVTKGGRSKTVTMEDGDSQAPSEFWEIVGRIDNLTSGQPK